MPSQGKESQQQPTPRRADSPHPALKLRHTLRGHTDYVFRMALSPDGRTLASPSWEVRLWDVESGRGLKTLEHQAGVVCVGWSPDGATLATSTRDNKVCLWDAATGRQIRILEGHGGTVNGVAWSSDGKTLASCSDDHTIRLWDTASGRVLHGSKDSPTGSLALLGRPTADDSALARWTIPSNCGMR